VGALGAYIPIPSKQGRTTVVVNMTLAWAETDTLKVGRCTVNLSASVSYCVQGSESYLYGWAWLNDKSNGTSIASSTAWPAADHFIENTTDCFSGACSFYQWGSAGSFSGAQSFSWWFNISSMQKSHHYVLWVYFSGGTYVSAEASNAVLTGARATAGLNFASGGNGATLTSITES
jgi:hypothetical protein